MTGGAEAGDGRRVLVTGGAGFIGSNLADRLLRAGHAVTIFDSRARPGVERNLAWLRSRHGDALSDVRADVRDASALREAAADTDAVFHFAAQVAVTTSMVDPVEDFEVNLRGTLNLLEAVRRRPDPPPVIFASTNKVYGDLGDLELSLTNDAYVPSDPVLRRHGIGERRPLDFHTPYGCSKGAADQYVLDWGRSFGVPTAVLRMSCIYGPRQLGTEDQGWVAHFAIRALEGATVSLFGDGCQVRDILDVDDAVDAYLAVWRNMSAVKGLAFNLGGGAANAVSLRQVLRHLEALVGHPVRTESFDWRAGDQKYYVSDTRALRQALGLAPARPWQDGVARLVGWLADERGLSLPQGAAAPGGGRRIGVAS